MTDRVRSGPRILLVEDEPANRALVRAIIARTDRAELDGIALLEAATIYAGALYGVDPLDQPGVELGKVLTYGLMGREGYEAPSLQASEARWTV